MYSLSTESAVSLYCEIHVLLTCALSNYFLSLVGVPFPRREASPSTKMSSSTASAVFPQSLEQLLERQWEQGSQFLMEQAQNFDSEFYLHWTDETIIFYLFQRVTEIP